jgi:hypothetical protein
MDKKNFLQEEFTFLNLKINIFKHFFQILTIAVNVM